MAHTAMEVSYPKVSVSAEKLFINYQHNFSLLKGPSDSEIFRHNLAMAIADMRLF